ncbi:MAG: type II secretion system protein [Synergistaceae bacterium]|nr:type II secretion system protein [Synergistaceae bacterium]
MANRKKGFTLVELLIVIVVIGVLSAMMMLSSTEAVSSAKATNIINNLRNWKTATLEWYADNIDKVDGKGKIKKDGDTTNYTGEFAGCVLAKEITKYLGGEFHNATKGETGVDVNRIVEDSSGYKYWTDHITYKNCYVWFIICQFPDDAGIKEKLEARASSAGLLYKSGSYPFSQYTAQGNDHHRVCIEVINFAD